VLSVVRELESRGYLALCGATAEGDDALMIERSALNVNA
jgi:hypothetical protein